MKRKSNKINYISLFFPALILVGCNQKENYKLNPSVSTISIEKSELSDLKIKSLKINADTICSALNINGTIIEVPEKVFTICLPFEGIIKDNYVSTGAPIKKNQVLANLQNASYIDLKSEFLLAKTSYNFQKQAFERQGELAIENVTSIKKLEESQYNFQAAEIQYKTLYSKLLLLGIDPEKITQENLDPYAILLSPTGGKIINCFAEEGKFYQKNVCVYTIALTSKKLVSCNIDKQFIGPEIFLRPVEVRMPDGEVFQSNLFPETLNDSISESKNVLINVPENILAKDSILANVKITMYKTLFTLPKEAIINGKYIFLEEMESKVRIQAVTIVSEDNNSKTIENFPNTKSIVVITNPSKKLLKRFVKSSS